LRYFNLNIEAHATKKGGAGQQGEANVARSALEGETPLHPFNADRRAFIFFGLSLPRLSAKFWNVQAFRTVFE
jgi:hypothetical protein